MSPTLLDLARAGNRTAFERLAAKHLARAHRFLANRTSGLCRPPAALQQSVPGR